MGRRSLNSFFVLSLVSLSTTAALWQESRNCLTYCADHITCCEDKTEPHQNEEASVLDDNEVKKSTRTKRSVDNVEPGKENEQFYRYYNVAKRSSPHVSGFDRSKDADMMMRLGKRSVDNFNHMSDFHKRQTASMMRMGKRSVPDTDNQESADRIYRLLMNKRQTSSMMRMGKRSAFNGDMMRMGKRESAFYDDARFGKRVPGDMMRMGKRYLNDDTRFGKRVPGDMMRMGKRDFSDEMRFGKRDLSSFNGDMMRMGKRSAFNDDMRFGKRDYPEITEDMLRDSLNMDDEGLNTINKRSSSIWKKNKDADLMRMGKRSAFNDDMMRMGKRQNLLDSYMRLSNN